MSGAGTTEIDQVLAPQSLLQNFSPRSAQAPRIVRDSSKRRRSRGPLLVSCRLTPIDWTRPGQEDSLADPCLETPLRTFEQSKSRLLLINNQGASKDFGIDRRIPKPSVALLR